MIEAIVQPFIYLIQCFGCPDRGKAGGRKKKFSKKEIQLARPLMDAAVLPVKEVAEKFGVSVVMLHRI